MKRLTEVHWRNLDPWERCGQDEFCARGCHERGGCANGCIVPKLYDRLAAYEDTGLTPEEIMAADKTLKDNWEIQLDRLKEAIELIKAKDDGRLVVLPCKVGDILYHIFFGEINETKVRTFFIGYPSYNVEKLNMKMIRTDRYDISIDNIGKTVFLTREEAEAALKKMEVDNEAD